VHGAGGGATVLTVTPGTPAASAGLHGGKRGDVITAVDGTDVSSSGQLVEAIARHRPGDDVLITYRRGKATTWARVKLGTKPPPRDRRPFRGVAGAPRRGRVRAGRGCTGGAPARSARLRRDPSRGRPVAGEADERSLSPTEESRRAGASRAALDGHRDGDIDG